MYPKKCHFPERKNTVLKYSTFFIPEIKIHYLIHREALTNA